MNTIAIDARIINSSTGRYVERLLHYLQEIDTENSYTVLVREKDRNYWQPSAPNFTVRVAEFDNYSLAEQTGLKRFLDELKPDLVHFCMPQQPAFYQGKSVTTFHDLTLLKTYNTDKNWLEYRIKQLIGRQIFKRVAKKSQVIFTPTNHTKQELIDFAGISEKKVVTTYEAAEPPVGNLEAYKDLPFEQFIMYVGQQPDYKNIRRLGEAHQKLLEKYPDLGLVLVGKLAEDAKRNKAHFEKQGFKNVHFTGFIPDAQRDWLYQKTAAYVFPSLMEGFGLPGLEAMAAGAPVASSNTSCLPEVYGDAVNYFNPLSVDDMADSIDEVLSNEQLRSHLVEEGHKQVGKYSWRRMAEQTHAGYLRALGATNSSEQ